MSSYVMKMFIENEFDKVVKEFSGSDETEQDEDDGMSREELAAERLRQATDERELKARQAKIDSEREEARQKIRDKYNIKKKDDPPTKTKHQQQGKIDDLTTRIHSANAKVEKINGPEPQGFNPVKMTTDAFNSLKKKFGWK